MVTYGRGDDRAALVEQASASLKDVAFYFDPTQQLNYEFEY